MTHEEIEQLLDLLRKANENCQIDIYDDSETFYEADYIFSDRNKIIIKIKEF